MLKPGKDFKEFADLVGFLAQVAASYKRDIPAFHVGLVELLNRHYALLDPNLRRSLVSALIPLHNRGSVTLGELLPLFFRLFRCPDKQLRLGLSPHRLRGQIRNKCSGEDSTRASKLPPSGAQETRQKPPRRRSRSSPTCPTQRVERRADRQPRRGRVSPSPSNLVAALRALGQDEAAEAAATEGASDDEGENAPKMGEGTKAGTSSGVSKEDVYRAYNKGATSRRIEPRRPNLFFTSVGFTSRRLGSSREACVAGRGGR